jgi:hypothetical protein
MVTLCCNISQHRASNFGAADLSKDSKKIRAPDILVLTTRGKRLQHHQGKRGTLHCHTIEGRQSWNILFVLKLNIFPAKLIALIHSFIVDGNSVFGTSFNLRILCEACPW